MTFDNFEKDIDIDYVDVTESYTRKDNQDDWFEVVDMKNSRAKALCFYKGCSRVGIWFWDLNYQDTLEQTIKNIIKEVY